MTDLASAHVLTLDALREAGIKLAYNLGNGRGFSVREVIETARKVDGASDSGEGDAALPGGRSFDPCVASSDKIKRELNWQPKYANLDEIVRSARGTGFCAHPNGYDAHRKSSRASSNGKKKKAKKNKK